MQNWKNFFEKRRCAFINRPLFSWKNISFISCKHESKILLLFLQVALQNKQETVSSLNTNDVIIHVATEGARSKNLRVLDIPGHGTFRQYILQRLNDAIGIIVVIDSANRQSIVQASDFIYDVLNSQTMQNKNLPLLLACNKQDITDSRKATQIAKDLETEM